MKFSRNLSDFCLLFRSGLRSASTIPSYTNCIVTMVWADGVNRTPPMVFTYNPDFQNENQWIRPPSGKKRRLTDNRRDTLAQRTAAMKCFSIQEIQVKYLYSSTSKYCKESASIVRQFFEAYRESIPKNSVVFHDSGTAFNKVTEDLTGEFSVQSFVEYPSCVHELISPNDNNLHGACKQVWRNQENIREGDLYSTLHLLYLLGNYEKSSIINHFQQNFILSPESGPTFGDMHENVILDE